MGLSGSLLVLAALLPAQQPPKELYQDFRDRRPLSTALTLFGRNADDVIKPEKEGLRITPPKDGTQTWGWGVAADFTLSGDFEITGTYEWLTVEQPIKKSKVGVTLQLAPNDERPKWAQVGRYLLPQGGVYSVEFWDKTTPRPYAAPWRPTEARIGQLRLVREGSIMSYWAKEGLENEFQKIHEGEFGKDDLGFVRFVAVNNSNPTTVDVRLLDLRIRSASVPAVTEQGSAAPGELGTQSMNWPTMAGFLGLAIALAIVVALGLWIYARQSRRAASLPVEPPATAPPVSFSCSTCGKHLKAKAELAGKKVKCSQCGSAALVPVLAPNQIVPG